ncbi:MAG: hypothetical protein KBT10_00480 [Bacteroidales bacterium]|nr:hypothetical protein [Candidatus Sodaliphilus aphodohippi]
MKEFDENDAINFIRQRVPACANNSGDDILLVIDAMFDYYEDLAEDAPDEVYDIASVVAYVTKMLKKDDENQVDLSLVTDIVTAELDYEDSLDD